MVDFVYPQAGEPGEGGEENSAFPSISAASPSTKTYKPDAIAPVKLPVFTASGEGIMHVTVTVVTGAGTISSSQTGPGQSEYSDDGTADELNIGLSGLWLTPQEGSKDAISLIATIRNDAGDESDSGLVQVENDSLLSEGQQASASVTISGTTGSIQLLANGKVISEVVPFDNSLGFTASELAANVNSVSDSPKFIASVSGSSITLKAPLAAGSKANGWNITAKTTGDMSINGSTKFTGGIARKKPEVTLGSKLLDGAISLLPTIGTGIISGLLLQNMAKVEVTVPVESEQEVPDVAVLYDGIMVPVPNVYTPAVFDKNNILSVAPTYSQEWDKVTFKSEYEFTNNPAWCLLEFVKNKRWGCGTAIRFTDAQLLTFHNDIYEAAKYCDELLSDGYGGVEPRFTLNTVISGMSRREALDAIASCMNAFVQFTDQGPRLMQDRLMPIKRLVVNASVTNGDFKSNTASVSNMFNTVNIQWNNPDKYYAQETTFAMDPQSVQDSGERNTTIAGFGITSEAQARRKAKYVIVNEAGSPLHISYVAGMDHNDIIPGDIVAVCDNANPKYGDVTLGGRVLAVNFDRNTVNLDRTITFKLGNYLFVTMPNGDPKAVEVVSVGPNATGGSIAVLKSPLPDWPLAYSTWIYSEQDISPRLFKVVMIAERSVGVYEVSAVKYDPYKFGRIDGN